MHQYHCDHVVFFVDEIILQGHRRRIGSSSQLYITVSLENYAKPTWSNILSSKPEVSTYWDIPDHVCDTLTWGRQTCRSCSFPSLSEHFACTYDFKSDQSDHVKSRLAFSSILVSKGTGWALARFDMFDVQSLAIRKKNFRRLQQRYLGAESRNLLEPFTTHWHEGCSQRAQRSRSTNN